MPLTTVISGIPRPMSHGHLSLLLQFGMVLGSSTENASYFCEYVGEKTSFFWQLTKQVLKSYYKS